MNAAPMVRRCLERQQGAADDISTIRGPEEVPHSTVHLPVADPGREHRPLGYETAQELISDVNPVNRRNS